MAVQPKWSPKDPQDVRDYWVEFSGLLADGETVTAAVTDLGTQTTPDAPYEPLAIVSDDLVGSMVRVRLSGGKPGKYSVEYHITTSTGQEFDLTKFLKVEERKQG